MIVQARPVRQSAAVSLGELSKLSTRVDALAGDLCACAGGADPGPCEAYLTALRGVLVAAGHRLSPSTLSRVGAALGILRTAAGVQQALLQQG